MASDSGHSLDRFVRCDSQGAATSVCLAEGTCRRHLVIPDASHRTVELCHAGTNATNREAELTAPTGVGISEWLGAGGKQSQSNYTNWKQNENHHNQILRNVQPLTMGLAHVPRRQRLQRQNHRLPISRHRTLLGQKRLTTELSDRRPKTYEHTRRSRTTRTANGGSLQ